MAHVVEHITLASHQVRGEAMENLSTRDCARAAQSGKSLLMRSRLDSLLLQRGSIGLVGQNPE